MSKFPLPTAEDLDRLALYLKLRSLALGALDEPGIGPLSFCLPDDCEDKPEFLLTCTQTARLLKIPHPLFADLINQGRIRPDYVSEWPLMLFHKATVVKLFHALQDVRPPVCIDAEDAKVGA